MFSKGDNFRNFLFAHLEDVVFPNRFYSYRKEFTPIEANSVLYEMTSVGMGGSNENDRIALPDSVPIQLKTAQRNRFCYTPQKIKLSCRFFLISIWDCIFAFLDGITSENMGFRASTSSK